MSTNRRMVPKTVWQSYTPLPLAESQGGEVRVVVVGNTKRASMTPPMTWEPIDAVRRTDVLWQAYIAKP